MSNIVNRARVCLRYSHFHSLTLNSRVFKPDDLFQIHSVLSFSIPLTRILSDSIGMPCGMISIILLKDCTG